MPNIPNRINGVMVEFSPAVNKSVDQKVIEVLNKVVKNDIAPGHTLKKIYILTSRK